jgi:hypothetical protein
MSFDLILALVYLSCGAVVAALMAFEDYREGCLKGYQWWDIATCFLAAAILWPIFVPTLLKLNK